MRTDWTTRALTLFDQGFEAEDRRRVCPEAANAAREIYFSSVLCCFSHIQSWFEYAFQETELQTGKGNVDAEEKYELELQRIP